MQKIFLACIFILRTTSFLAAQSPIDVLHYQYHLTLSDATDTLKGNAAVTIRFLKSTDAFALDLASVASGKGMHVDSIRCGSETFSFTHVRDTLFITPTRTLPVNDTVAITIAYAGVPADGLIISKNKWGERTFFADNWPNRAHHWLPCNDRPDDKATVSFSVTAPAPYSVISNGVLREEKVLANHLKHTTWEKTVPIPTKVMVVGVARFAIKQYNDSNRVPVSAWVYPQDSTKGFYDYALAPSILAFLSDYIGPYPFRKLANVQSTTIFGGMENASAIFYGESTVTGDQSSEGLLAHEIAHQWFGNSATEQSFAHLWLSEGFATYLTHLYLEQRYGRDTLIKGLQKNRYEVIQFAKQWPYSVVDSLSPLMDLLNANSYEKGGWVLHMLRQQVGDSLFKKIIQTYYHRYQYSNADTWAFEKVVEDVTGNDFTPFFKQWLYTPGMPKLNVHWKWRNGTLALTVQQQQKQPFSFPLTIAYIDQNKKRVQHKVEITQATQTITLPVIKKPVQVLLDPDTGLLFEGTIRETQ